MNYEIIEGHRIQAKVYVTDGYLFLNRKNVQNIKKLFFPLHPLFFFFIYVSDIMDLRHQSSAMCIIMLGGEDTHPWSATKKGNPIPATIPVDQ